MLEDAFPPERFTLPGHDPVKEYDAMENYLKTYSDRTIRNVFWSGNNYALPQPRHIVAVSPGEVPWNDAEKARMQALNKRDVSIDYAFMVTVEKIMRHGCENVPDYMLSGFLRLLPLSMSALQARLSACRSLIRSEKFTGLTTMRFSPLSHQLMQEQEAQTECRPSAIG